MTGTQGFLWQLTLVLVLAALFSLSLWQKLRRRRRIPFVVPFGFAVVFAIAVLIFVRQASGIYRLQHLSADSVLSISYKGKAYQDPEQISIIIGALRRSQWWSARSSDMVEHESFSIHFRNGTDWAMVIGPNRYGSGIIIEMADHEFSRGYAFNPVLIEALKNR